MSLPQWDMLKAHMARTHARSMAVSREQHARALAATHWPPKAREIWWFSALAGLFIFVIAVALFWDWNMMRGPLSRWASERTGREVHIDGNLAVNIWSWTPRLVANGVRVGNPDWAGGGDMADAGRFDITVKLLPLLRGALIVQRLDIERANVLLVRDQQGRANWDFASADETKSGPLKLPAIRRLTITDTQLQAMDKRRGLTFSGTVESNDTGKRAGFFLNGDGKLNGALFTLDVHGGSLLHADPTKPYAFDAKIRAGTTRVTADGSITKPFDFGQFEANVTFAGTDLANLYYLTGLALPNTPPYSVKGHLTRDDYVYKFQNFAGVFGNSDLEGDLTVDATHDRPLLTGAIGSRRLDFDDLGAIFGADIPGAKVRRRGGAVVAAANKGEVTVAQTATRPVSGTLLLPDAPLDVERIRQMDARVTYHADSIKAPADLALHAVDLGIVLDNGVLTLDPLTIVFRQGRMTGHARIDAQHRVPVTDIDLKLSRLSLAEFFHLGREDALEGTLAARARLHGVGNSVHKAASTANGTVTFVVPHGEIRKAFAELMGIDVLNGLGLLMSDDKSQSEVRCAVASFRAQDGVLRADQLVFDTDVVRAHGSGSVNLREETMDLTLKGEPKKFRLLHVGAPITIQGPLTGPSVGVKASDALGQGGLAVALGAIVSPVAALLPFVDPGLAEDADCGGLMSEARQSGAPVSRRQAARTE